MTVKTECNQLLADVAPKCRMIKTNRPGRPWRTYTAPRGASLPDPDPTCLLVDGQAVLVQAAKAGCNKNEEAPTDLNAYIDDIWTSLDRIVRSNETLNKVVFRVDTFRPSGKADKKSEDVPYEDTQVRLDTTDGTIRSTAPDGDALDAVSPVRAVIGGTSLMTSVVLLMIHRRRLIPAPRADLVYYFDFAIIGKKQVEDGTNQKFIKTYEPKCFELRVDGGGKWSEGVFEDTPPVASHGESDTGLIGWLRRFETESCLVLSIDGDMFAIALLEIERRYQNHPDMPKCDEKTGLFKTNDLIAHPVPSIYFYKTSTAGHWLKEMGFKKSPDDGHLYDSKGKKMETINHFSAKSICNVFHMNEALLHFHASGWTAPQLTLYFSLMTNDFFHDVHKAEVLNRIGPSFIGYVVGRCGREMLASPEGYELGIRRMRAYKALEKSKSRDDIVQASAGQLTAWGVEQVSDATREKHHKLLTGIVAYWTFADEHPFQPDPRRVLIVK